MQVEDSPGWLGIPGAPCPVSVSSKLRRCWGEGQIWCHALLSGLYEEAVYIAWSPHPGGNCPQQEWGGYFSRKLDYIWN